MTATTLIGCAGCADGAAAKMRNIRKTASKATNAPKTSKMSKKVTSNMGSMAASMAGMGEMQHALQLMRNPDQLQAELKQSGLTDAQLQEMMQQMTSMMPKEVQEKMENEGMKLPTSMDELTEMFKSPAMQKGADQMESVLEQVAGDEKLPAMIEALKKDSETGNQTLEAIDTFNLIDRLDNEINGDQLTREETAKLAEELMNVKAQVAEQVEQLAGTDAEEEE